MKLKILVIPLICLLGVTQPIFSQISNMDRANKNKANMTIGRPPTTPQSQNEGYPSLLIPNPQLALSTPDYRVTAGDVYTLAYLAGANAVEYTITVDSTYRIRVSNLAIVDAAGKTFNQLKTQVETIVSNNYPLSGVQFVLRQPATFKVYIRGEVDSSLEIQAWALTRLSTVLDNHFTPYASTRNVSVRSSNGQVKVYDLYKADRMGDISQNPYVRPDDVITINRVDRQVTIDGAIERPGTYQLLAGENLKQVIEVYASGFTSLADKTRVELIRYVNSTSNSGDKLFLNEQDIKENYALEDFDSLWVPEITALQPVIFVEGAVGNAIDTQLKTADPTASTRLVVPFNRGEYYGSLIRANRAWFSAVSDTKNAYIIRGTDTIFVNLNPMLYDENFRGDNLIMENDILIIPFRQYFVTVAGAVITPGRYPYIPDRTWDYYVALAGGFVAGKNKREAVNIVDITGKKITKTDVITPETIITARTNDWLFYVNQFAPVVTAVSGILSIVLTSVTIQNLANR